MSEDAASVSLTERLELRPMTQALADRLGPAIAGIDPWSRLGYPAASMTAFLAWNEPSLTRMAIIADGAEAGAIVVRRAWLQGPYLQLLALLPPFQGHGFGAALLGWFEAQATAQNRWVWLCRSSFNERAGAFYARHGFEVAAELPDLMVDGIGEVLMRKRVNKPG